MPKNWTKIVVIGSLCLPLPFELDIAELNSSMAYYNITLYYIIIYYCILYYIIISFGKQGFYATIDQNSVKLNLRFVAG